MNLFMRFVIFDLISIFKSSLIFVFQFYFQAVVDVIEAMNTHTEISMCKLLKALYDAIIITPEMMNKVWKNKLKY